MVAPSSDRDGAAVIWIAVHTMEGIVDADDAASYFARSTNSSSHAVADDTEIIEGVVPYSQAAWTLRGGNPRSDNLELCAFADMNRAQWLSKENVTFYAPSVKRTVTCRRPYFQLVNAAAWIRSRCVARGIPLRKLGPAEVGRNERGVIGHVDYTEGKNDGTHWDPGPGFPWDVVMALAIGGEQDVDLNDSLRPFIWPFNDTVKDTVGSTLANTQSYAAAAARDAAITKANTTALLAAQSKELTEDDYRRIQQEELAKIPTGDIDEAKLAEELDRRGIGITKDELLEVLTSVRLTTGA